MLATITTDASWSPRKKVASFAFWISSNKGKLAMSGMLKGVVYSPDEAEMGAIANAVHYLFGQKWPLTRVIVNTDSMNAIHVLTGDRKNIKKYNLIDKKYDLIRSSIAKNTGLGFKIEYRHVKAHQGTGTKRQYCNEWCDQEAKKQLSKYHEADKRANP